MDAGILKFIGYITGAGCLAAFGYSLANLFFVSRYSTYEERAIKSLGHKLKQINVMIDPEWLYHLSVVVTVACFLCGFALGGGDVLKGTVLGAMLGVMGFMAPRIIIAYLKFYNGS